MSLGIDAAPRVRPYSAVRQALVAFLLAAVAQPCRAQDSHTSTSLGPRAVFYRPRDADHGSWSPGGQLDVGLGQAYAIEMSVDVTRHSSAGANYREIPVQLTLKGFLQPEDPASLYLLAGYGWYFSRVDGPGARSETQTRPHVGAGLELLSGTNWTLDADYRFIWSAVYQPLNNTRLLGNGYHKRGSMIMLALTRRF